MKFDRGLVKFQMWSESDESAISTRWRIVGLCRNRELMGLNFWAW